MIKVIHKRLVILSISRLILKSIFAQTQTIQNGSLV